MVRLEMVSLRRRMEYVASSMYKNMYVRIVPSWANHCEHKIIIPSTTEWYQLAFGCWLLVNVC